MKNKLFAGFDTSNYTTSVAVCDGELNVLCNLKRPLPVREGERGLRQSEAVFAHVKNLPSVAEELRAFMENRDVGFTACAVSATPRSEEGSYMPCFLVGQAACETLCAAESIPVIKTTHQAGHIVAAAYSACRAGGANLEELLSGEHIALHVSGGTTDLLYVSPSRENIVDITRIGGSEDANAGQIIDRTGVRLGFRFPCGPELDRAALSYTGRVKSGKLSVHGMECNLSGLENKAMAMIERGADIPEISAFVLEYIASTLEGLVAGARKEYGSLPVVFAGGVMSSAYIKRRLAGQGMFAEGAFSADNAAGVALVGAMLTRRKAGM